MSRIGGRKCLKMLCVLLLAVNVLLLVNYCGYVQGCVEEERLALVDIKAYMISYADVQYPWYGSGRNCCGWSEVRCNMSTGRVIGLDLSDKVEAYNPWMFNVTLFRPFKQLISLDLSWNHINGLVEEDGSTNITTLKNLRVLKLDFNYFETRYFSVAALTSLRTLSLEHNSNEYIFPLPQGICKLKNLLHLNLPRSGFSGAMPSCLHNLSSLQFLDISFNNFVGKLPKALSNMTSLHHLDVSLNYFEGEWSLSSLANNSKLHLLLLSGNSLEVHTEDTPWKPMFPLRQLGLGACNLNKLDGSIPKFLLHQYSLREIDLSSNNLSASFPSWLLINNSHLTTLKLANNSFTGHLHLPPSANSSLVIFMDFSSNKFQGKVPENIGFMFSELRLLNLSGNHFEGHIPTSVVNMSWLDVLDFSNNYFSGELPRGIFSYVVGLSMLDLSNNNLQGEIMPEDMYLPMLHWLKLSNNLLSGMIKGALQNSSELIYLDISNNSVIGHFPGWIGKLSNMIFLSMSDNNLQGHIPGELCRLKLLQYLDLSENDFSGPIPSCYNFSSLVHIHLHNNRLTGLIPSVLSSSSGLETLDLRDNQLLGVIPFWIGKLPDLSILLLAGNSLRGQIPYHLCQLKHINILDLSRNNLSGDIPVCFVNMSFGLNTQYYTDESILSSGDDFRGGYDHVNLEWKFNAKREEVEFLEKNQYLHYTGGVLRLMSGLDLSCNKLTGIIPPELGKLSKIRSLNFSHNHLTGSIPSSFSQLKQLESLDLSSNNLSGTIPSQLVELTFLASFNVSFNNLTGRVPEGGQFSNFDERNYLGNPGLSGFPDSYKNTTMAPDNNPRKGDGEKDHAVSFTVDVLWSFGMSCGMMFLATVAIIYINPQWRQSLFDFVEWHFPFLSLS